MIRTRTILLAAAAGSALSLAAAGAQAETKTYKGAPEFEFGALKIKPRGRIFLDQVWQEVDRENGADEDLKDGRLRMGRIGVQGSIGDVSFVVEHDFGLDQSNWEDVYVEYAPSDGATFTAGHFKTVALENMTSDTYTTFMERGPFTDVLGVGRTLNVQGKLNGKNWTAAAFVLGDNINNPSVPSDRPTGSEEQYGFGARLTYAPIVTDTTQAHLGAWVRRRDRADQSNYSYGARNNTNFGSRYVNTGGVGVRDTQVGLEGALVHKAWSVQGEWANAHVERILDAEDDVQVWYVFASWFLTGESRRYQPEEGQFGRVKVKRPVTQGGPGALELAVRYDRADLTDVGTPLAGEYSGWTVGANWYLHPYMRVMANYTASKNELRAPVTDVDVQTFQVRAQFDW
jgi:phosphate-selective porin OprO/OprP